METVLITGGGGFTGRYLAEALRAERGIKVVSTSLGGGNLSCDAIACDLSDPGQTQSLISEIDPDYVVHLAGLTFVGHSNPIDFYRTNVLGTDNLLSALVESKKKPRKVVVASSANIYGSAAKRIIPESVCPLPVNHYAASKLAQENLTRTYFSSLPVIITRPFNYTGRGQDEKFVIPKIVRHFREGANVIELGDIDVERDFSDVRDIVDIYVSLIFCDASSTVVNLCSGKAVSIREVLWELERIAGYSIKVKQDEKLLRRNEIPSLRGDTVHLESLVGNKERIPMSATLEWMHGEG